MRCFFKKISIILIIFIFIISISAIFIPIVIWSSETFCNISSSFFHSSLMTIIFNRNFELKDIITWIVAIINILITGIFSLYLWKAANRSNKIAESLNNSEKRRDERIVEKSAATIYYDILNIMYTLIEAFKNQQKSSDKKIFKKDISLILSNEKWTEDIVQINGYFSAEEIDLINFIYRESDRLQTNIRLNEDEINEIQLEVERLFNKTMIFDMSKYTYLLYRTNVYEKLFNTKLRILLEKLYIIKENTKDIYSQTKEKYLQGSFGKKYVIYSSYDRFFYGDIIDSGIFKKVNWDGFLFYSHKGFQLRSYFGAKDKYIKRSFKHELISNIGSRIGLSVALKNKKIDKYNIKISIIDFCAALFKTIYRRVIKINRQRKRKRLESKAQEATIFKVDEDNSALFKSGKYQHGIRLEIYDNGQPWYALREGSDDIIKQITLYEFIDKKPSVLGYNSFYKNSEGRIPEFKGTIKKGRFNSGEGTLYFGDGKKEFDGVIKDSKYITGTQYDTRGNVIAKGEYDSKQSIYTGYVRSINDIVTEEYEYKKGEKTYQKTTIREKDLYVVIEYSDGNLSKGKGTQWHEEKVWYKGEFCGKSWSGKGIKYNNDKSIKYEGEFLESKYNGYGRLYHKNNENEHNCVFEGVFRDGRIKEGQAQRLPIQIADAGNNKKRCKVIMPENYNDESNEHGSFFYYGKIFNYEPTGEGMIEEVNKNYQSQFSYVFENGFYTIQ